MATAYAALTSLMHLINDLHEHPNPPIKLEEEQFETLCSKICFFKAFLKDHHTTIDLELEMRIAEAARAAEDLIDAHMADEVLDEDDFSGSLRRAIESVGPIEKEVIEIKQNKVIAKQHLVEKEVMTMNPDEQSQGNNQPASAAEDIVVGLEDMALKIMDKLTSQPKLGRQIISITGMGGIGKTTLARKVYDNKLIKEHFDIRAWATISKEYDIKEILKCLGQIKSQEGCRDKSEPELSEMLHKSLFERRYLVILDDVWDVEAWDRLRSSLPASSGSGIVVTTRESNVASSISPHIFRVDLLDEPKSWDLFCKTVFGNDSCPPELGDVGRKIVKNCRGLPLSIVVIGSHLAKSPRTQKYWIDTADNLSSILESNEHCLKILSLSYTNLPVYLKSCFLYIGIYPEDVDIWVSEITRVWIIEGILEPANGKSLEEAAEEYLNDLIARNLIVASGSYFKIHDLLRDLCLKEALEKNFFRILKKQRISMDRDDDKLQVSFDENFFEPTKIRVRRLKGEVLDSETCRLLQQLTINDNHSKEYPALVNLQEVTFFRSTEIPASLCFHWNLRYLVIDSREVKLPPEIWKVSQLRHIQIDSFSLPDPPSESRDILMNLQSALRINNFSFSEDSVKRLPNIKNLGVEYDDDSGYESYAFNNIARLEKLESFDCWFEQHCSSPPSMNVAFPHSLKKLTFSDLHWDDVTTKIGSLPLLEVLQLYYCRGGEWNHVGGQFVRLKYLELHRCDDLQCFEADVNYFPCLEKLVLFWMDALEEISSDIGDIPTLTSISLSFCHDSAVQCAKDIADVQTQLGNENFQLVVE